MPPRAALAAPPRRGALGAECSELPFGIDVLRIIVRLVDDVRQLRLVCRATRDAVEEWITEWRAVAREMKLCEEWCVPPRAIGRACLMRAPMPLAVRYTELDGALAATAPLLDFGVTVTLALRCSPAELAEAATRAVAHAAGRAGAYALSCGQCTSRDVESIEIPAIFASVGRRAFAGFYRLRDVTFEEGSILTAIGEGEQSALIVIGEGAFFGCRALRSIALPANVKVLEKTTFSGCSSLERVTLPASLTEIMREAFSNCSKLQRVECDALKAVTLPANVEVLGKDTFSGCSSLERVTLPASLTEICERTFLKCSKLQRVVLPASVKTIGASAFKLLTTIEPAAFSGCAALRTVAFPSYYLYFSDDDEGLHVFRRRRTFR
ncbi:hypothetical protein AB1Y20_020724 [Prymnesium parvum]|uniref:Uncharacterized protein n=1 Tax=Prymnesium parvum TaxID=97485 RepID=A0AB34JY99_PRYPA